MLLKYLKQPYPLGTNSWSLIIAISLFVALFMVVFQPFGLSSVQCASKFFVLGGYGFVTFGVLTICLKGLSRILGSNYSEECWTVGREILWHLFLITLIGMANGLYSIYFNLGAFSMLTFLRFLFFTFAIAIIPVVVLVFINQNRLLSKNLRVALELSAQIKEHGATNIEVPEVIIEFKVENDREKLLIPTSQLLYIESKGNYIKIYYLRDGKISSSMLRSTLKETETLFAPFDKILRCHRGFFVNLLNVISVKGNSQGYRLCIRSVDVEIPVSRAYTRVFQESLQQFGA